MPDYQAYVLTEGGHIAKRIDFPAPDDDAALDHARQLIDGHDIDLWAGKRPLELSDQTSASQMRERPATLSGTGLPSTAATKRTGGPLRKSSHRRWSIKCGTFIAVPAPARISEAGTMAAACA